MIFLLPKLVSRQLVGMLIVVLVRKSLKGHFGKVKTSTAGSGILGVMVLSREYLSKSATDPIIHIRETKAVLLSASLSPLL